MSGQQEVRGFGPEGKVFVTGLKRYKESERCPKCGSGLIEDSLCTKRLNAEGYLNMRPYVAPYACFKHAGYSEHIDRKCQRCGNNWTVLPLDAPPMTDADIAARKTLIDAEVIRVMAQWEEMNAAARAAVYPKVTYSTGLCTCRRCERHRARCR